MNHFRIPVFLIVAPCERCGGFVLPLHTHTQGWRGYKLVGSDASDAGYNPYIKLSHPNLYVG